MLAFALFLLVAAVVLILVGALAHGFFWLLGVGCVVFLAALAVGWLRSAYREWSRSRTRR
jgi:hypothetical protein